MSRQFLCMQRFVRKIGNRENIEFAVGLPIENTFKTVCQ
jgi:hypothetical protein